MKKSFGELVVDWWRVQDVINHHVELWENNDSRIQFVDNFAMQNVSVIRKLATSDEQRDEMFDIIIDTLQSMKNS